MLTRTLNMLYTCKFQYNGMLLRSYSTHISRITEMSLEVIKNNLVNFRI